MSLDETKAYEVIMMLNLFKSHFHQFESMIGPSFPPKIGLLVKYFFTAVSSKSEFTSKSGLLVNN